MKKSEILGSLAGHLDIQRLLAEYPALGRDGLSALIAESARMLGPVTIKPVHPEPRPKPGVTGRRKLIMHTDGASRGNPGESGIGVFIEEDGGQVVAKLARYMGTATNNQAEYTALLEGLAEAHALGADEVEVYADSELMVKQVNGLYKVKNPDLQTKHAEALKLLACFRRHLVKYVPREQNREADALANEAIDKRLNPY